MELSVKQLKEFKAVAGTIKQSNLLPILSYLKFNNGKITKNNLESFVIMDADFKGSMLIDEKILFNFVDFTSAETIDIKVKDTSVIITDGKAKVTSPTDNVEHFPSNEQTENDAIELPTTVLYAIKVATSFTNESDNTAPYKACVFIGNGIVAASTGFVCYTETVAKKLPQIILSKATSDAITKFETVSFSENDTYQFFSTGNLKYGFVKKEVEFLDMRPFAKLPDEKPITIGKSELIKFCEMCIASCPGRLVICGIENGKMIMKDGAYGIDIEIPMTDPLCDFTFNPAIMSKMLKSLPDEQVSFVAAENKYFVTGESDFVALIMGCKF